MKARAALSLLGFAAALSSAACVHGTSVTTFDARTLRATITNEATPMRATYFPSTAPRTRRRDVPLVVVEPILFRRELLYRGGDGGLVSYLQSEGFPVWLVWIDAPSPPDARSLSRGIAETVASIAKESGVRRVDLIGLSLGAEATLRALEPLTAPGSAVEIRRVVFLGGGLDFAYPHSFASRVASVRGGPASAMCSLDGDVGCAREFHAAATAVPWLGAIPVADDDELLGARERFPFVGRFMHLPVLFVAGKADGLAPSEAIFPVYSLWGSEESDAGKVPKLFFLAGRENGLGWDFDAFDLLSEERGERVWEHVVGWLARGE